MSQQQFTPGYQPAPAAKPAGMAIASLVLGIISLFFCIWYIAIPCGILAIIFGVIAGNKVKQGIGGGEGMAKAGLIMGCIGLAIDAVAIILLFTVGIGFMHHVRQQIQQQQMQQQSAPAPAPAPAPTPSNQ